MLRALTEKKTCPENLKNVVEERFAASSQPPLDVPDDEEGEVLN